MINLVTGEQVGSPKETGVAKKIKKETGDEVLHQAIRLVHAFKHTQMQELSPFVTRRQKMHYILDSLYIIYYVDECPLN